MSLRIPLTRDQTLQTEFHEIERRLRRLERASGVSAVSGPSVVFNSTGAAVNLKPIQDRLTALEVAIAALGSVDIPEYGGVGPAARNGLVPSPGLHEPPTGVAEHILKEDGTWGYPFRGLIEVTTPGDETGQGVDSLTVHGNLNAAHLSVSDIECLNLHTHGDIEYEDSFWDDLRFPASGFNPAGSTAPPSVLTTNGLLSFSGMADNIMGGVAQMPHAWKEGTALRPHIHLAFPTANPGTNTRWKLEYNVANVNADFTTDTVTYTALTVITVANPNNVARHVLAGFEQIPMSGKTVSACVLWRLTRLAGTDGADDDTNACTLIELDFHYERDSPGSSSEYVK